MRRARGVARAPDPPRSKIAAWALWDCGSTGMNAIVATFVFSVYLTGTRGPAVCPATPPPASWLGRALTVAGIAVALLAPLTGVLVQAPHRRRIALVVLTALAAAFTASMSLIRADPALPCARAGPAGADRGLRRPGQRSLQRDAATVVHPGRRPAGSPDWAGRPATPAASCCSCWSTSASSPATGPTRGLLQPADRRRPERAGRDDHGRRWLVVLALPLLIVRPQLGRRPGRHRNRRCPRRLPAAVDRPAPRVAA